jgi:Asp-tRNA(Asn)/Glu-tRNA(Gln) amidotransferase A subunit family amidase
MEESRYDSPSDTVNRTRIMICNANDLSPDQKAALETLLGRRVQDGEAVSVRTFEPATVSHERKLEIANELRNYFAEVDAARKPVSEAEAEDIITEAMRSVRPGYRPHQ